MWYELDGVKYTLTDIRRRHPDTLFPPGLFDPTPLGYTPCDPPAPEVVTPSYQDAWRALAEQYETDRQALLMAFLAADTQGSTGRRDGIRLELADLKTQYRADQAALDLQYP